MLEKIKYVNSKNQVIKTATGYFIINENDLRDYTWNYEESYNKIISFNKEGIKQKKIEGYVYGKSDAEATERKNDLFNIFEYDIVNNTAGRLYIGNYYLKCYIIASQKSDYLSNKRYTKVNLTIVYDTTGWIYEKKYLFSSFQISDITKRDYQYGYKYDFSNKRINQIIENIALADCKFKLTIYGSCINPSIVIGKHEYNVNVELFDNERLVIDSISKKIYIIKKNGEKINCFNLRNRDSYIFEPIPSGVNYMNFNGLFNFELTLYIERSEPEWI